VATAEIVILYFAGLRDLLGMGEERLALPEGVGTVSGLADHLVLAHPELRGRLESVRFAVNESFAEPHEPVKPGDIVALIPPVAGG
jgi:molybdopterin converting factor subunit 1